MTNRLSVLSNIAVWSLLNNVMYTVAKCYRSILDSYLHYILTGNGYFFTVLLDEDVH